MWTAKCSLKSGTTSGIRLTSSMRRRNLVYVNTGRTKKDGTTDEKAHERKLKWDEENRLLASDDDGFVTNYWYDADGERTVKTSGESEQVYVNSGFAGGRTNTARFSLYVSPYLVANQGGRYTKHIYIGGERIVSKIGDFASYGPDPRRIEYAGSEADAVTVDYDVKYSQQLQAIKDNYATFGVPYNGTDNDDYVNGEGFCCDDGSLEAAQANAVAQANALDGNFQEGDAYENLQFYYHSDHLGSTSYITNLDGEVVQHIEYVPFGEVFIEERNNTWNTPYLFNAKEFDEETGLYYYGARYYDPRLSLWMSVDIYEEKYPFNSTYCYAANNPIKFIDPDGRYVKPAGTAELMMIQNTLPKEARGYVRLDQNGFIDRTLLNSYRGESLNFNNLKSMVNSDRIVEIVLDDKFTFMRQDGNLETATMSYIAFDPKYDLESLKDLKGKQLTAYLRVKTALWEKLFSPIKMVYKIRQMEISLSLSIKNYRQQVQQKLIATKQMAMHYYTLRMVVIIKVQVINQLMNNGLKEMKR